MEPILQVALAGQGMSEQQLFDTGVNVIRPQMVTVPGVSIPWPYGGKTRNVSVDIDLTALKSRNLTPQDVVAAIEAKNMQAAVGRTVGYDYHQGYLQAGAVEVPLLTARNGDVIQITNPANTRGDADYVGLHTAIVLDNYGDGTFRVIDSNSNYDGIVRIRDQYDPAVLSRRTPGLVVRVYRIEGQPGVVANPNPTPPANLIGGLGRVAGLDPEGAHAVEDELPIAVGDPLGAPIDPGSERRRVHQDEPVLAAGRCVRRVGPAGEREVDGRVRRRDAAARQLRELATVVRAEEDRMVGELGVRLAGPVEDDEARERRLGRVEPAEPATGAEPADSAAT